MSDIVEKTLSSLPRLLSENLLGGLTSPTSSNGANSGGYQYGTGLSRGFYNLMRNVEYARSVAKEQLIIQKDLSVVQQKLSQPDISTHQIRDYLTRLIFCHMMGYDTSFGYIHAVKLAQQGSGWMKWMGYLSCGILLHEDHELIVLLVNTILKDLRSTNILDNCIALSAASSLVNAEMIPVVLPLVEEKLRHSRSVVRKKAVTAFLNIWSKSPGSIPNIANKFSDVLCDQDPGVVNASLICYQSLIKANPSQYKNLTPAFLNILKQILKRKLPAEYEYHSIPNPWMQISLLKLLSFLGADDKHLSTQIYPVLKEVLQCANMKENMAFAITYECILTITHIVPNQELLDDASRAVSKFLHSSNQNLKYLGMKSLTALVIVAPKYAVEYQMIIMEYLENPDPAIQRKTLELMYQIANPANIKVISQHLLKYISKASHDPFWQADIVAKLFSLVEKLSSCDKWYVDTINKLLEVTKGNIPNEIVYRLLNVIDNASKKDKEFSHYMFTCYMEYLRKESLPNTIIQVAVWVISENPCEVSKSLPTTDIVSILLSHFCNKTTSDESRCWIWTAMTKIMHTLDHESTLLALNSLDVADINMSSETNQRFQEVKRLTSFYFNQNSNSEAGLSFHVNQSFTSELDFTLSFVDDYVSLSLENGAMPFKLNQNENNNSKNEMWLFDDMQYDSYPSSEIPPWPNQIENGRTNRKADVNSNSSAENTFTNISNKSKNFNSQLLQLKGIKKVWTKDGIIQEHSTANSSSEKPDFVGGLQGDGAKELSQEEEIKQNEKQQFATALFAGISPQDSFDVQNNDNSTQDEKTKNLSSHNDKRDNISSETESLSEFLKLSKNKKGFDWHSFSSKPLQSEEDGYENLGQEEHSLKTDTEPFSEPSEAGFVAEPESDILLVNKTNSLYEEYYSILSNQDDSRTENHFVDKQIPSSVDTKLQLEAKCLAVVEGPHVLHEKEELANLSSENYPMLNFIVLSEFEEFIIKSFKRKTADGLILVLSIELKMNLVKQLECQIQLTCAHFLKLSVIDDASGVWSSTETSDICGTIPVTSSNNPLYITIKLKPLEMSEEQLSFAGNLQLKQENSVKMFEKHFPFDLTWIDFCNGCSIDIAQFADAWQQFSHMEKISLVLPPNTTSFDSYIDQLQLLLPAKCIFGKENEALLCGQCLDFCTYLIHIKLLNVESTLTILLKSGNRTLLSCLQSCLLRHHML
ncbi:AP-4 complex subunit epsilon-1 isoform X2 [Octopus bimaculoides]|uniref:AP-4 complex subunit epsilon-1 isoform X2 n=1 Tax=Octopus bimaculoides TaxID=37653 RepID=UPI00071D40AD|nr:AP-4 complex subunit epsilon-1 isoform X2 [Octopus bimaculoides]|eukprot:XP_014768030.1 PREDICTED: AP-4 complex subunit epsilon-1-like isoform X2 [Octopus bimaculoides]